jgi:bifunctional enzyme CysN/CysC
MSAFPDHKERALPIVVLGHVDHGKSTLIGRLLHDTGSLPDGKVEQLRAVSEKRGLAFEWSFLLDALQIERDQGITVDITQTWFRTAQRRYVVIDAPGHTEFLKNMVTGAAKADAALLVVDAAQGVSEQTRRHAYLMHLLGIRQVAVLLNKMDMVDHSRARFEEVSAEIAAYLGGLGIVAQQIVPISARNGDNVSDRSTRMDWYRGLTVLEALDRFVPKPQPVDQPLRLPVQDMYRTGDRRIVVGRIESGRLRVGDQVRLLPGGRAVRVAAIEGWNRDTPQVTAAAGESVALRFDDEVFVERGFFITGTDAPMAEGHRLRARVFWLGREPLTVGQRLKLRLATAEHDVLVDAVERVIDVADFGHATGEAVERNGVAEVIFRSRSTLVADAFGDVPVTGRGVLAAGGRVSGGFIVESVEAAVVRNTNLVKVAGSVSADERARVNGHAGAVVWLTGLSGAGKSTIAMAAQRRLFDSGRQVTVLDGDNLRHGLNSDLGFTAEDRKENVRRAAEVARLFADNGGIVLVSLISPYSADRERARQIVGDRFAEVFVRADLDTCLSRDPKGLYAKARAGAIANFTGVSAEYQAPATSDLVLDTGALSVEQAVERLLLLIEQQVLVRAATELNAA